MPACLAFLHESSCMKLMLRSRTTIGNKLLMFPLSVKFSDATLQPLQPLSVSFVLFFSPHIFKSERYLALNCAISSFIYFTAYFEGRNLVGDADWQRVGKNCQLRTYGRFFFFFPLLRTFERTSTLDAITILSSLICEHFTRTLLLHGHCERRAALTSIVVAPSKI